MAKIFQICVRMSGIYLTQLLFRNRLRNVCEKRFQRRHQSCAALECTKSAVRVPVQAVVLQLRSSKAILFRRKSIRCWKRRACRTCLIITWYFSSSLQITIALFSCCCLIFLLLRQRKVTLLAKLITTLRRSLLLTSELLFTLQILFLPLYICHCILS